MVLPAFPFKSPNSTTKVLGNTPDKAEETALAHLNGLCSAIGEVYSPGACLVVVSDGLVYNGKDLLGVPDHVVWNYGQQLRALTEARQYRHIEFARVGDLLGGDCTLDILDGMSYSAVASTLRFTLMQRYGSPGWDAIRSDSYVKNEENKRITYCGYLKFLELDLASRFPIGEERTKSQFKKGVEMIAKRMLKRGEAFARAVRENFPDHVRLSIHASTGEDKISINVLPVQNTVTPWHSCIGYKLDGTVIAGHRSMFEDMDDMGLVYENGKPSFFRQRSKLYDWGATRVIFEPKYPCGLIIRPADGPKALSIEDIDAEKTRALAEYQSPVILRGFTRTKDRERFVAKAHQFGKPAAWKFGLVLEVKDQGSQSQGLNNVLSREWMPFHFDGMFKTEKRTRKDGTEYLATNPPRFQVFTAVTPSPKNTGFTLFACSRLLFNHLPPHMPLEKLQSLTWTVSTSSFDQTKLTDIELVVSHPTTGQKCLKYHERWPQEKTSFEPTFVEIENGGDGVCDVIEDLLHDRRVCYWHTWEEGDVLVNDNFAMLHTRSSFEAGNDRELWRINFD
ncbi:Clavaminate synthase-like protein, partial [Periconia macrospinosa]